ncbi:MAG: hypothetical protein Q9222_004750, partial [Ikaeria aurantiellina]
MTSEAMNCQRVDSAMLMIRLEGIWKGIGDIDFDGNGRSSKPLSDVASEVENVVITGKGIKMEQSTSQFPTFTVAEEIRLENKCTWQAKFKQTRWSNLRVQESVKWNSGKEYTKIDLLFTYHGRPEGSYVRKIWREGPQNNSGKNVILGNNATVEVGGPLQSYFDRQPLNRKFPLAELCKKRPSDPCKSLEVWFSFQRIKVKTSGSSSLWSWPAACTFLSGWPAYPNVLESCSTTSGEDLALQDWVDACGRTNNFAPADFLGYQLLQSKQIRYELIARKKPSAAEDAASSIPAEIPPRPRSSPPAGSARGAGPHHVQLPTILSAMVAGLARSQSMQSLATRRVSLDSHIPIPPAQAALDSSPPPVQAGHPSTQAGHSSAQAGPSSVQTATQPVITGQKRLRNTIDAEKLRCMEEEERLQVQLEK